MTAPDNLNRRYESIGLSWRLFFMQLRGYPSVFDHGKRNMYFSGYCEWI